MNKTRLGLADLQECIRGVLRAADRGMRSWEIEECTRVMVGRRYSDSSISARLREMEDVTCDLSTYRYTLNN